jgi:acetyl-CoA acetyltransferase
MLAVIMRRYMHNYGATGEDFARVAVAMRRHAATNPAAYFYRKPITIEDHQASRMIADPFRLLDCCQESDGAIATVVTSRERARDLRQKPVLIAAVAQGACDEQFTMTNYYRDDISHFSESALVAQQLFADAGIEPADVDIAMLYDHFGPTILPQLEAYGFCGRGEAKDFIKDGNIEIGGTLPVNTNGGQLGEAYMHGLNGITEAVRQLRGTAVNQIDGVQNILTTGGPGTSTSGAILSIG